jgi:hypothetical protein
MRETHAFEHIKYFMRELAFFHENTKNFHKKKKIKNTTNFQKRKTQWKYFELQKRAFHERIAILEET